MKEFEVAVGVENVIKIYTHRLDNTRISALQGCDLFVKKGELVSVIGPSGAGKSTLLRLIAGVEQVSSGKISVGGVSIQNWDEVKRREFRRKFIGTFSQHARENLDPKMTVADALRWELTNAQWKIEEVESRIEEVLQKLNLYRLKSSRCGHLSSGEAMRVSLAKAIAKKPFVVLADEPTGQLDTQNMQLLHQLMLEVRDEGTAVIVATHDVRFQKLSDRSVMILDGKMATEEESIDLLMQHRDLPTLLQKGPILRNVVLDSNSHIRLPTPIVKGLNIGRRATLSFESGKDFAVLKRHPDDFEIKRTEEIGDIEQIAFSRKNVGDEIVVQSVGLSKEYIKNQPIIKDLDLTIKQGELVILLGPSGVGKTTLLSLFAGLEPVSTGFLEVLGIPFHKMNREKLASIRLHSISFLTQNYILHPYLSVMENILLSKYLPGKTAHISLDKIRQRLRLLGIDKYENVYPTELSGGQRQRVAFVASLEKQADFLLFDEPTANLDSLLGRSVMNVITKTAESGKTVVIATHDLMSIQPGARVLRISEHQIIEDVIATDRYCQELRNEFLHSK